MKIIRNNKNLKKYCNSLKNKESVGFVPTMGCLHEGHLSLIKKSKQTCSKTIVSIFVNKMQFGKNEDFSKYPRPLDFDIKKCKEMKCDLLFIPDHNEIYNNDFSMQVSETDLSKKFCGFYRQNHFTGVLTIVLKLLNLITPDILFLGQKDYQQCLVINKMIMELNLDTKLKIVNTKREKSGLALSSRNKYLSKKEKESAPEIYFTLKKTALLLKNAKKEKNIKQKLKKIKKELITGLSKIDNFQLQYADIVCAHTLSDINENSKRMVVLVAGFFRKTRLIDNILI